jgi:putative aldouronate transport system substrate-binding protein
MAKKYISLALVLLFAVGLLAGCSKEVITENSPEPTPVQSSVPTKESNTEPAEKKALAVAEGGEFKLPLTDSKTFTIWVAFSSNNMLSLNDSHAYQEFERRTGIHIDWQHVSSASAAESFNLAMASQDYADSYMASITYLTNGADYYVENGIIVDLEPYIPQYAPNYDYVRNLTEGTKVATLTDSGMCVAFYKIMQKLQWAYFGPLGRYDWLEELGMDVPETYNELHDVLVAFRDNYNPEMPLSILPHGIDDWLLAGFDTMYSTSVTGNVYIQKNGVAPL